MGNRTGKILGVCVAALAVVSLSGCAFTTDANKDELEKRGFKNVTQESFADVNDLQGGSTGTYFADAGGCRVVLRYTELPPDPGDEWVLYEKSSKGSAYDLIVPNPTAVKVGTLDAFQHCYNSEPGASTPSPSE